MVSLLVYEFHCANTYTVMHQNFVSLPILFWVFPVASLKSKLSLSHELAPFLCGHRGNICRYTKPAFILITFTCSNSLRDARVHPVWCYIFILSLTNLLWMVFKSNWFFFYAQMWSSDGSTSFRQWECSWRSTYFLLKCLT